MTIRLWSRRAAWAAGAAMFAVLAAGCADDGSDQPDAADQASPTAASEPDPMEGMDDEGMDMMMNDPDAVPANELDGAVESEFAVLETAPPGSEEVAGTAWLALGDDPGTTLTVTLAGLEPGAEYIGHLHEQSCDQDSGGAHFKFDPDGGDLPPNEVHIGFTAGDDGTGTATITNPESAEGAGAVVIHPAEAMDNRLVCADL